MAAYGGFDLIAQGWSGLMSALATGTSPGPLGSAHPLTAPYQAFATADGWVNVGASNEASWVRTVEAVGMPGLARDPCFRTNADRRAHLELLVAVLAPRFATRTAGEWMDALTAAGVPVGPVAAVGEMLEHPQTHARGMVVEAEHTRLGRVRTLGTPVKLSGSTPPEPRRGAPLLGEHTREVMREAGFSAVEVEELIRDGVVVQA